MPFPPAIPPFSPEVEGTRSPESIQDCAIGEEADEPVSHSDFVEEGLLRFHNVSVWHPEELHETRIGNGTEWSAVRWDARGLDALTKKLKMTK